MKKEVKDTHSSLVGTDSLRLLHILLVIYGQYAAQRGRVVFMIITCVYTASNLGFLNAPWSVCVCMPVRLIYFVGGQSSEVSSPRAGIGITHSSLFFVCVILFASSFNMSKR